MPYNNRHSLKPGPETWDVGTANRDSKQSHPETGGLGT